MKGCKGCKECYDIPSFWLVNTAEGLMTILAILARYPLAITAQSITLSLILIKPDSR